MNENENENGGGGVDPAGRCILPRVFLSHAMAHYYHAREKHPYFADELIERGDYYSKFRLERWRASIEKRTGYVRALTVLHCEIAEIADAYADGDIAHAVEECYDTIAVLMRMIDVMEGRQKLGKPVTINEYQAQEWGLEKPIYEGTAKVDDHRERHEGQGSPGEAGTGETEAKARVWYELNYECDGRRFLTQREETLDAARKAVALRKSRVPGTVPSTAS